MVVNCFRYLGFTSLYDIQILTLYEYEARMYAYRLKQIDKQQDMHLQAWLNHQVTATKESGKKIVPVFKKFEDFFNYEKQIEEVKNDMKATNIKPQQKRLANIAAEVNARGG